jgi:hypothetical protein
MKKYTITEIKLVEQLYTYEVEAETEEEALEKCENIEASTEEIGECRYHINSGNTYDNKVIDDIEELE